LNKKKKIEISYAGKDYYPPEWHQISCKDNGWYSKELKKKSPL